MAIKFPSQKDVTLERPPLKEVVCQVRFAPILRIAERLPSEFQEKLRKRFPQFAKRDPLKDLIGAGGVSPLQLPNEFIFETSDGQSFAALGVQFIALSTRNYLHWTGFRKDLEFVLKSFEDVYGPILATRIGLRYINELNLETTKAESMTDLIQFLHADLAHLFQVNTWHMPETVVNYILLKEEVEHLAIRINIERSAKPKITLDYDYYAELDEPIQKTHKAILKDVARFHRMVYNAFRWSITKYETFKPLKSRGKS